MKIALVCPYNMFERTGGVQQIINHLYEGLTKRGHIVKVITQRPSGFKGDIPKDYILFGVSRNFRGGFGTHGNWGLPSDSDEIARALESENFDVIHFHEPWMPILAWQMLKHSKAAHVGTFHANLVDVAAAKYWVNMFLPYGRGIGQQMQVITAVSPAPATVLINKASKPAEKELISKLKYIPPGVDLKFFKPFKKKQPLSGPNTKTIVYVGRLEKRKGVDWLLLAFAELVKEIPNAHLIIAGSGTRLDRLRQFTRDEKVKNVSFMGYVTDEQKRYLLGNADLACFPATYGESFGIVILEAMAMGVPVIAGNNIGYAHTMQGHGRIGLVDPQSTEDFANRLAFFLTDKEEQKLMVDWALKSIKKYDYPKIIDQYLAAYNEAIEIRDKNQQTGENHGGKKRRKTLRRFFVRR